MVCDPIIMCYYQAPDSFLAGVLLTIQTVLILLIAKKFFFKPSKETV